MYFIDVLGKQTDVYEKGWYTNPEAEATNFKQQKVLKRFVTWDVT